MSFTTIIAIFLICAVICLIGMFISAIRNDTPLEIVFATLSIIAVFAIVARTFLEMIE